MPLPRSVRSTGEPGNAYDAEEFDGTRRSSTVYLFTRPVDQNLRDSIEFHHWALVFVFQGDDVRTAEGFPDDKERLYPKYTKLYPQECGTYYEVCKMVTSPTEVLEKSKSNSYNNEKYMATWQNCQTWVKDLARQMGGELAKNINNYQTLREANPIVAVAGKKKCASGFGSFSRS